MVYTTGMRTNTETLDIPSSRLPSLKVSGSRVASGILSRSMDGASGADKVNEVPVVASDVAGDGSDQVDWVKNQGAANPSIEGQKNHVDHNDKVEAASDQGSGEEKLSSPQAANQGGTRSCLTCYKTFHQNVRV